MDNKWNNISDNQHIYIYIYHTEGYSLVTISTNSQQLILPSPSLSAYWIICWIQVQLNLSPTSSQTFVNYSIPNVPVPLLSNTSNNCCRDRSLFVYEENPKISRNCAKSIYQDQVCVETMCKIFPASFSSPRALIAVMSYYGDTNPLLSQSNTSKHYFSFRTSSAVMFFVAYFAGSNGGGPYGFFGTSGTFTVLFWADDLDIFYSKYNDIYIYSEYCTFSCTKFTLTLSQSENSPKNITYDTELKAFIQTTYFQYKDKPQSLKQINYLQQNPKNNSQKSPRPNPPTKLKNPKKQSQTQIPTYIQIYKQLTQSYTKMQYITSKWNYKFTTNAGRADAYSPFAQHINDIEDKRSRLFPDRRTIPGRKIKYILAFTFAIHFYFVFQNLHKKTIFALKNEQQAALQRKIAPLFQAMQDQQYTTIKHRQDLLAKEVLGEDFVRKSNFHNRLISWVQVNRDFFGWARSGVDRYQGPVSRQFNNRYLNGFETQNI